MTLFSILSLHNYLRVRAFLLAGLVDRTAPFAEQALLSGEVSV